MPFIDPSIRVTAPLLLPEVVLTPLLEAPPVLLLLEAVPDAVVDVELNNGTGAPVNVLT